MPFLNVIPQGDVKLEEVKEYIKAGATAVGIGRNLTNCDSITEIEKRTKKLLETLNNYVE
jgi:2-keto-3-deoxy-6-phosphogluconate aldolase